MALGERYPITTLAITQARLGLPIMTPIGRGVTNHLVRVWVAIIVSQSTLSICLPKVCHAKSVVRKVILIPGDCLRPLSTQGLPGTEGHIIFSVHHN